MTVDPARMAALEALAEAADDLDNSLACGDRLIADKQTRLRMALRRYRALSAQPQPAGEVVTLAVWEYPEGDIRFLRAKHIADSWAHPWKRLGTVTLPLTVEPGA